MTIYGVLALSNPEVNARFVGDLACPQGPPLLKACATANACDVSAHYFKRVAVCTA